MEESALKLKTALERRCIVLSMGRCEAHRGEFFAIGGMESMVNKHARLYRYVTPNS